MLDWLFGPRIRHSPYVGFSPGIRYLRHLTLDIEALSDLGGEIERLARERYQATKTPLRTEYAIPRGSVEFADLQKLHAADRAQLVVTYTWDEDQVRMPGSLTTQAQPRVVMLSSAEAQIQTTVPSPDHLLDHVTTYLYQVGVTRPDWQGLRWMLPMLLALPVVVAYVWVLFTTPIPPAVHALVLALVLLACVGTYAWSRSMRKPFLAGSLRYRGESRVQTNQRRADERKNIKVAAVTAVLTLIGGIILAAALGVLNLDGDEARMPDPTTSLPQHAGEASSV